MSSNAGFTKSNRNWLREPRQSAELLSIDELPAALSHVYTVVSSTWYWVCRREKCRIGQSWKSSWGQAHGGWSPCRGPKRPSCDAVKAEALVPVEILRSWDARVTRYPPRRAVGAWSRADLEENVGWRWQSYNRDIWGQTCLLCAIRCIIWGFWLLGFFVCLFVFFFCSFVCSVYL